MIRLLPTTDTQTLNFIPREYIEAGDIYVVIREDGTGKVESIYNLTSTISGNFLQLNCQFTALTAENSYFLEVKQNNTLIYRDKIYCTSQTSSQVSHTLNQNL